MIGSLQVQKKQYELISDPPQSEIMVVNLSLKGFDLLLMGKDLTVTKIAEFAIKDRVNDHSELTAYFQQFCDEFQLQKTKFTSVYFNWIGNHFTLVPNSYYEAARSKEILEFNIGSFSEESVYVNEINDEIKLIFSIPTELKSIIDKIFPHHHLNHIGSTGIKLFFTHFQLKKADVYLNILEGQTELMIKKDKKLLLYNIFDTKTNEDILYYLLFSMEQFKLDPLSTHLAISANRETGDELFSTIKKYIKHVNFAVTDKSIQRKDIFETVPHHYYFSLLNRVLCE